MGGAALSTRGRWRPRRLARSVDSPAPPAHRPPHTTTHRHQHQGFGRCCLGAYRMQMQGSAVLSQCAVQNPDSVPARRSMAAPDMGDEAAATTERGCGWRDFDRPAVVPDAPSARRASSVPPHSHGPLQHSARAGPRARASSLRGRGAACGRSARWPRPGTGGSSMSRRRARSCRRWTSCRRPPHTHTSFLPAPGQPGSLTPFTYQANRPAAHPLAQQLHYSLIEYIDKGM